MCYGCVQVPGSPFFLQVTPGVAHPLATQIEPELLPLRGWIANASANTPAPKAPLQPSAAAIAAAAALGNMAKPSLQPENVQHSRGHNSGKTLSAQAPVRAVAVAVELSRSVAPSAAFADGSAAPAATTLTTITMFTLFTRYLH